MVFLFTIIDNAYTGCMPGCGCTISPHDEITISFDEFFEVMAKKIKEERRFSNNIIFESSIFRTIIEMSHVTCFLCPFVKDSRKSI